MPRRIGPGLEVQGSGLAVAGLGVAGSSPVSEVLRIKWEATASIKAGPREATARDVLKR